MKRYHAQQAVPPIAPWERALVRVMLALGRSPWGVSGNGHARGILHVFRLVEWLSQRGHGILPLGRGGLARYEVGPLPRGSLPLPGGGVVQKGEPVVILHFDNRGVGLAAEQAANHRELGWQLFRSAEEAFMDLARLAETRVLPSGVRAVWGETIFYTSLKRAGFSIRASPPNLRTPFARLYFLGLAGIYDAGGVRRLETMRLDHLELGETWIGLDDLQRRYGSQGERTRRLRSREQARQTREAGTPRDSALAATSGIVSPDSLQPPDRDAVRSGTDGGSQEEHADGGAEQGQGHQL